MLALCFECGSKKNGAMRLCKQCHAVPKSDEERVLSLCLSLECVTQRTLNNCRAYFKKKNKSPRFKPPIVQRAKEFLDEQMENSSGNQSVEFSSSVFNFDDMNLVEDSTVFTKTITAHIIGKGPSQDSRDANANLGKAHKTYHRVQWAIGQDISEDEYESNKDNNGDVYVWYRWLSNQWTKQCVSQVRFDQLKAVESGRMG